MTSREEFEQWYQRDVSGCNGEFIAKDDAGEYLEVYTFRAWVAWQAARATTPAWHDAPTEPGLWVQRVNKMAAMEYIRPAEIDGVRTWRGRWFGPIPQAGGES